MIPPPKHKWRGSQCSDHSASIKKNWNGSPIRISIRVVTHTLEARNIRTSSKVEKDTSEEVWGNIGKLSPRATLNALKTWLVMFQIPYGPWDMFQPLLPCACHSVATFSAGIVRQQIRQGAKVVPAVSIKTCAGWMSCNSVQRLDVWFHPRAIWLWIFKVGLEET